MTQRNGVFSLREAAHELCRLVTKFSPIIRALYPENAAILAALAAAMAACEALDTELQKVQEQGV